MAVRIGDAWDEYVQWVRPRLMKEFKEIASMDTQRLQFAKSLDGDVYTLQYACRILRDRRTRLRRLRRALFR